MSFYSLARRQRALPSLLVLVLALLVGATAEVLTTQAFMEAAGQADDAAAWAEMPWYVHTVFVLPCVGVYAAARGAAVSDRWRHRITELTAERRLQDERQRIALDLHDVIGHAVTLMVLQAAAAEAALDTQPARARESLVQLRHEGRSVITELHRVLRVLRATSDEASDVRLAAIPALVAGVRAAGRSISYSETGTPTGLAPGVEVSAYRIVQEALTNAGKYGATETPVDLRLAWQQDSGLLITISTPLGRRTRPALSPSGGLGILGMTERALAAGGSLEVIERDGCHRVVATLPGLSPARL